MITMMLIMSKNELVLFLVLTVAVAKSNGDLHLNDDDRNSSVMVQLANNNKTKSQMGIMIDTATITTSNTVNKDENRTNVKEFNTTVFTDGDDVTLPYNVTPTTYRPLRSTVTSPVVSAGAAAAQERDTKLMNLLAARRSALQRGSTQQIRRRSHFRGTTKRTPYATESTSTRTSGSGGIPLDARSSCIFNCTENFTRRTTAVCMRRCANIERMKKNTTVTTMTTTTKATIATTYPQIETTSAQPSKKTLSMAILLNNSEKDTNEILFTDESSHGLFVITKEINDTINHIPPDMGKGSSISSPTDKLNKYRTMKVKPPTPNSMMISNDDMEIAPYLYFGQKLPPLKPSTLNITPVSDDHPKVLEVSVAKPKTTLRSRQKYNPRERNAATSFKRRIRLTSSTFRSEVQNATNVTSSEFASGPKQSPLKPTFSEQSFLKNKVIRDRSITRESIHDAIKPLLTTTEVLQPTKSSTTLLINVPDEVTEYVQPTSTIKTVKFTSSEKIENNKTTARPTMIEDAIKNTKNAILPNRVTSSTTIHASNEATLLASTISPLILINVTTSTHLPKQSLPQILKTTILSSVRSTVYPKISTAPNLIPFIDDEISTTIKNVQNENNSFQFKTLGLEVNPTANNNQFFNQTEEEEEEEEEEETSSSVTALNKYDNDQEVVIEKPHMNAAFFVLGGLICVIPIALIAAFIIRTVILRRKNKNDEDFDDFTTDQQPISPVKKLDSKFDEDDGDDDDVDDNCDNCDRHTHRSDINHNNNQYDEQCSVSSDQEFDRRNIRLKSLLGEGNFGQVWKAEADDLSGHLGATRLVAVKTVRECSAQVGLKDEANIMRKLGSHPNVVTLLGACVESEPQMLIMEYAMRGRLLSLLRAARSATNILPASVPGGRSLTPLSPRTLAGFALDISCGMEYIAERRIVHRDLAARNVLLDHNGVCKICDFGMSIDLDAEEEVRKKKSREHNASADILRSNSNKFKFDFGGNFIMNHWSHNWNQNQKKTNPHEAIGRRPALPIRWMAPESLQFHIFSTETDVWAFGIVLWEIATLGSTPYANLSGREVVRCVPNGVRPELPKEGRHEFSNLMSRCWHKEPQMRPSFRTARIEISRFLCKWVDDDSAASDYMDVSGFSEDLEHGVVYFNHRISEFECEI